MQRYIETLFRRKDLFLIPIIFIPLVTLMVSLITGREFVVNATVWVEPNSFLTQQSGSSRIKPNERQAIAIADRLRTVSFRSEIMERSGLTKAVIEGTWPTSTREQQLLASNPVTAPLAAILGFSPPASVNEAAVLAMREIRDSIKVRTVGDNLVVVTYAGPDPEYGQLFIENILSLHQEQILDAKLREQETGKTFLENEVADQKATLDKAQKNLQTFEQNHPAPPPGFDRQDPNEAQELATLQQIERAEREKYDSSRNRLEALRFASEEAITSLTLPFRIIDDPVAGSATSTISIRRLALMGMLGIALGSILGTSAIIIATWRDHTIRTRADVERSVLVSRIVDVPKLSVPKKSNAVLLLRSVGLIPARFGDR